MVVLNNLRNNTVREIVALAAGGRSVGTIFPRRTLRAFFRTTADRNNDQGSREQHENFFHFRFGFCLVFVFQSFGCFLINKQK